MSFNTSCKDSEKRDTYNFDRLSMKPIQLSLKTLPLTVNDTSVNISPQTLAFVYEASVWVFMCLCVYIVKK